MFAAWKKKIERLFEGGVDANLTEEVRRLLHESDVPASIISDILGVMESEGAPRSRSDFMALLHQKLVEFVSPHAGKKLHLEPPQCVILVGINGVGKTTTAARLAYMFQAKKFPVVLGAADTFRAGASEQLIEWGKSLNIEVIAAPYGSDPASVAFQAWQKAKAENAIAIIDTAGRMHTKAPLMDQLKKIERVLEKESTATRHVKLLVLDGHLGQNSIVQAKEFAASISLDGIILTKMDGSSKAGFVLQVMKELHCPVFYIGVGEKPQDLIEFNVEAFVSQLL